MLKFGLSESSLEARLPVRVLKIQRSLTARGLLRLPKSSTRTRQGLNSPHCPRRNMRVFGLKWLRPMSPPCRPRLDNSDKSDQGLKVTALERCRKDGF